MRTYDGYELVYTSWAHLNNGGLVWGDHAVPLDPSEFDALDKGARVSCIWDTFSFECSGPAKQFDDYPSVVLGDGCEEGYLDSEFDVRPEDEFTARLVGRFDPELARWAE